MTTHHRTGRRFRFAVLALALVSATSAANPAPAGIATDEQGRERYDAGWTFYFDNDALTPAERDEDYTGGLALTLAGRRAQAYWFSLDRWLGWVDGHTLGAGAQQAFQLHSLQFGALAFTPGDIEVAERIEGDRPYAGLVYLANGRSYVRAEGRTVFHSSLAIGLLGTELLPRFQRALHSALGVDKPRGWDHQIADGGEPTFRYTLTRQDLQAAGATGSTTRYELKSAVAGGLGYLTEGSAALSLRWGRINTPWWSGPPDRVEYIAEPAPATGGSVLRSDIREFYVWAGIKAKLRAYNAFLQGQFRDSELDYGYGDLRPLIAEAWLGATAQIVGEYRLSWVLHYQSSELREGLGDRDLLWGGVVVSHDI